MSKKKLKGRTMELNDFLSEGGKPVQAGFVVVQKKIDWSDENNYSSTVPSVEVMLPTAPISSRGGHYDDSKVTTKPPFTAFLGNLPFEASEEEIANFFHDLKLKSIRLVTDSVNRPKGFGYAEFEDRRSLVDALALDGDQLRNRTVKVGLPNENEDNRGGFGSRDRSGYGSRGERPPERDLGTDWRASRKEDQPSRGGYESGYARAGDRFGDRERSYGDRDRGGFGGDREREMSGDWRSSEGRGGFERDNRDRDRDRDRGGFGGRYEPPRDRESRGDDSAPSERPRLNLAPRTKPVEPIKVAEQETGDVPEQPRPKIEKPKASDIFGSAKPVDTAAREREIEAKLAAQALEQDDRENDKEKQPQQHQQQAQQHENNNEPARQPPKQERSWREESREEKEKRERERKARADRRIPAPQQQDEQEAVVMTSRNKFADLDDTEGAPGERKGE